MIKIKVPLTLIISVHWGWSALSTCELNLIDVLGEERFKGVHKVAFGDKVHDRCRKSTTSTVGNKDVLVHINCLTREVGSPELLDGSSKFGVTSYWAVLIKSRDFNYLTEGIKKPLGWGKGRCTLTEVCTVVLESKSAEFGPDCEQVSGL